MVSEYSIRDPEQGCFHAKGVSFRGAPQNPEAGEVDIDRRPAVTVVGSSTQMTTTFWT